MACTRPRKDPRRVMTAMPEGAWSKCRTCGDWCQPFTGRHHLTPTCIWAPAPRRTKEV
jgi:hypothetical protein